MTGQARTLLALDFDWSLIEENSDTFVLQQIGAEELYRKGRAEGVQWTKLMDRCLQEAAEQLGRTPADVAAALHATPFHPAMVALLREAGAAEGVDAVIVSDANTVYIDTILSHHGLQPAVLEVHSNPARWAGGALRVAPYHSAPHGCRCCPANLCKGQVLADFLDRQRAAGRQYGRVLYVGDGKGDFCPSTLLLHGTRHWHPEPEAAAAACDGSSAAVAPVPCGSSTNRVFARSEYPDGLPCSLAVMLRTEHIAGGGSSTGGSSGSGSNPDGSSSSTLARGSATGSAPLEQEAARVVLWSSPEQLAQLLQQELQLK